MNKENWKILKDHGVTQDNLTANNSLDLQNTKITELPDNFTVPGCLYLHYTNIKKLPDNLTVGSSLDLHDTNITELPDNLTVGGYLCLENTKITEFPDSLTVGGYLYLGKKNNTERPKSLRLYKGKDINNGNILEKNWVRVDGITSPRTRKKVLADGYVYYISKVKRLSVLISEDGYSAHGANIKVCLEDIAFKRLKDKGQKQYSHLKLTDTITHEEAVSMYRIITGACRAGTKLFIDSNQDIAKEKYTIQEIIEITENQYGNEALVRFFENK